MDSKQWAEDLAERVKLRREQQEKHRQLSTTVEELKRKLRLDEDFFVLCGFIGKMKEPTLKSTLVALLKENKTMYADLKAGREDKYKKHWEAFLVILTDFDL